MGAQLTELDRALETVLASTRPLGTEMVDVASAYGRVLATEIVADAPVPGFTSSAMDGFAVRAADVSGARPDSPVGLTLVAESRAGHPAKRTLRTGEAIAISTGAVLPDGADGVVRVEETSSIDAHVHVFTRIEPGTDIRSAGGDLRSGQSVLASGARLGAAALGVLASLGVENAACFARPTVSVLTTGDELAAPGEPLRLGMIHDTNSRSVPALAEGAGAEVVNVAHAPDDPAPTAAAISRALAADVAVVCGGVSVGAHDHVRRCLAELGVEEQLFGIALKPGKPTWFGTSEGRLVFALPGNPVSAMVTFILLVRPALWALAGAPPLSARTTATFTEGYRKEPGRAHAVRCRLQLAEDGWRASPTGAQDSHILTSMLGADALAIIPTASGSVAAGERVEVELLEPGILEAGVPA